MVGGWPSSLPLLPYSENPKLHFSKDFFRFVT